MKFISTIIKKIMTKEMPKEIPNPVGRWRIESCNKQMNQKIDLSNEDHCGPCGQYALEKVRLKNNVNTVIHLDNPK
jgi:glutamate mutase epsilon subunit